MGSIVSHNECSDLCFYLETRHIYFYKRVSLNLGSVLFGVRIWCLAICDYIPAASGLAAAQNHVSPICHSLGNLQLKVAMPMAISTGAG